MRSAVALARAGFADFQSVATDVLAVESRGHGLGLRVIGEDDKGVAARGAGAVFHDLDRGRLAERRDEIRQLGLGQCFGQISDVQFHQNSLCGAALGARQRRVD